ncbi:hypothetical protein ACHAWF_005709, partial [Thalassiosira exigua]
SVPVIAFISCCLHRRRRRRPDRRSFIVDIIISRRVSAPLGRSVVAGRGDRRGIGPVRTRRSVRRSVARSHPRPIDVNRTASFPAHVGKGSCYLHTAKRYCDCGAETMAVRIISMLLALLCYHVAAFSSHVHKSIITDRTMSSLQSKANSLLGDVRERIRKDRVFFIELGFGNDSHGQSSAKAAVRACRNAIEFNSIPSIQRLIPDVRTTAKFMFRFFLVLNCSLLVVSQGGYDALKLDVLLAIPPKYQAELDLKEVAKVFPYGDVRFELQDGGMVAPSGIAIETLGDKNDDMVVVCASVTVGY